MFAHHPGHETQEQLTRASRLDWTIQGKGKAEANLFLPLFLPPAPRHLAPRNTALQPF
ncbi:MAG: hypothetical protein HY067_20935 [Betaproteobacteria bacterium]|nr:hypothetical protein [Betaproteobacteria bacterium]